MDLRFVYGGGRLLGDFSDTPMEDSFEELRSVLEVRNGIVLGVLRDFERDNVGYGFERALEFWRAESEVISKYLYEVQKFRKSSMKYKGNLFNKKEIREMEDSDGCLAVLDMALGEGESGIDWFIKMDRETSLYQKSQSWIGLGLILLMHIEKYAELKFVELIEDVIDDIVSEIDGDEAEDLYSDLIHKLAESEVQRIKKRHKSVISRMKKMEKDMMEHWSGYDDVMFGETDAEERERLGKNE